MFEFLQSLSDFVQSGSYSWWEGAVGYLASSLLIMWLKFQLWGLQFAWGVAQSMIQNLGIGSAIQGAWASLPSDTYQAASFFQVPQALNILISAGVTRLVMSFIPFI